MGPVGVVGWLRGELHGVIPGVDTAMIRYRIIPKNILVGTANWNTTHE